MNEHVKEVFSDLKGLPLKKEQLKALRGVFINGAQQSGVISEKEAKDLKRG